MKRAALLTSVVVALGGLVAFSESGSPSEQAGVKAGAQLFSNHCSECHRYGGKDGLGKVPAKESKSPDLKGFASREWLTDTPEMSLRSDDWIPICESSWYWTSDVEFGGPIAWKVINRSSWAE